jgi:hypothetical protein
VVKQRRIEALLGGSKGCLGSLLDVVREKEKNMARSAQLVLRIKRGAAQGERLEAQRGRRGEVTLARRAQAGETAGGPAQSNSTLFELFKWFSNWFEGIRLKEGLTLLKNFQIKYGRVDNWIMNKFSHWGFQISEWNLN